MECASILQMFMCLLVPKMMEEEYLTAKLIHLEKMSGAELATYPRLMSTCMQHHIPTQFISLGSTTQMYTNITLSRTRTTCVILP